MSATENALPAGGELTPPADLQLTPPQPRGGRTT